MQFFGVVVRHFIFTALNRKLNDKKQCGNLSIFVTEQQKKKKTCAVLENTVGTNPEHYLFS